MVHEAFFRLHQALRAGAELQDSRAWLFRVARNLWFDRRRDGWRLVAYDREEDVHISPASDPEQQLLHQEQVYLATVEASLLSPLDRRCLELKASGMRYREIAAVLGISMTAAVESVRRGVRTIRRRLPGLWDPKGHGDHR